MNVRSRWLLTAGLIALTLNLRLGVASVPPVLKELQQGLGLSGGEAAVLVSIPVLCFGLFAPLAAPIRSRLGEERALFCLMALLAAGLLLRAADPGHLLFAGTALACAAIGVMNVLTVSLIKRRFHDRMAGMLGVYTLMLSLSGSIAAGTSVPIYDASGASLTVTLGVWAVPAVAALVVWAPQLPYTRLVEAPVHWAGLRRSGLAWCVSGVMGMQALNFYASLSWLPSLLRDRGASPALAGFQLAIAGLASLPAALLAPLPARDASGQRRVLIAGVALCVVGLFGVVAAPLATVSLWMVLLGLGQGIGLALALLFPLVRSGDPVTAASMSAMSQSVGYLVAAGGVLLVGLLHAVTGGWAVPVGAILALLGVEVACGMVAATDRVVSHARVAQP